MKYPNLRYGNAEEFRFYVQSMPMKDICRLLRRCERSIDDWLKHRRRIPWWVPEILRLKRMEHYHRCREHEAMGASVRKYIKAPLASVHELRTDRGVFRSLTHWMDRHAANEPSFTDSRPMRVFPLPSRSLDNSA